MQWEDTLRFAWWALATDKVKAALTMLGVMIGSAAIVLVVTIGIVGKTYVMTMIEGIGTNIVYASLDRSGHTTPQDEITVDDLNAIRAELPYVSAAAGVLDRPSYVYAHGRSLRATLVGVTEDYQSIRKLHILSGRYFDAEDLSDRNHVCIVSKELNNDIFGGQAVGETIQQNEFRCSIIGVFEEGVPTFGRAEIQEHTVLYPYDLMRHLVSENFLEVIYAQASASNEVGVLTSDISRILTSRHRAQARYTVENLAGLLQTANHISTGMTHHAASLRGNDINRCRRWDHEHHAGQCGGADARDRGAQGHWGASGGHTISVPAGSGVHQPGRGRDRSHRRCGSDLGRGYCH